jgi:serine/threonine-protein kinase
MINPGSRLGSYEIVAWLGAGGMGEVYRARDTRLDRTVAIKVLGAHRIADPQMRQRFDREARAVGALSHPHICHLNDVGHHDGIDFLVMEFLEGETLAARLARGRLALDETLRYGCEMAEALAEAHAHAIVHRDLKPANVMITKSGIKLLDFGLAKLPAPDSAAASLSTLGPTRETPLTEEGTVLGTWPYMAPEQLEGKDADARTDIFSFGAMLYEMSTGARAFEGESHASLIAAILRQDPPAFAARDAAAPPALERVVRKCLAKSPGARWQTARDLADALRWIAEERTSTSQIAPKVSDGRGARAMRWPWVAAMVAAAGLGAAIAWNVGRVNIPDPPVRRFVIDPPPASRIATSQFAISPDGRAIVYEGLMGRRTSLYVRSLDQLDARPIPGTENGVYPTFSPDGEWVAFLVGNTVKKASRTSGAPPVTLAEFPGIIDHSIAWLPDNSIVLGRFGIGLFRVPAEGGTPVELTTADTEHGEIDHHNPRWLPGGKALLITRHRGSEAWDVAVLIRGTGTIRVVVPDAFDARYVSSGHLVFARGETLLAAPFDLEQLEVSGPEVALVDRVMTALNNGAARYGIADDGTLVYVPALSRAGRTLAWLAPNGDITALPLAPQAFNRPSLSPDGKRLAVQIDDGSSHDIWISDLVTGTFNRMTFDGASEAPIWTPDGQRLTFSVTKKGRREVYWEPIDGTAAAELLVSDAHSVWAGSWSPDGQRLLFTRQPPTDQNDIGLLDLGPRRATMMLAAQHVEQHPRLSPNGRWLAYSSDETGRAEVVVTAFGGNGGKRQISSGGGVAPVWSRDGRTLYFRSGSDYLAVDVGHLPSSIGKPTVISKGLPPARGYGFGHPGFDVASDGRLLIVQPGDDEAVPLRFEVVLNWFQELKQRVPVATRD